MHDVGVGECTRDLADRVGLADVGEELVAQAFTLGGAAHDTGDVHEGHGGGQDALGAEDLRELVQARVGQGHDADVGLDGREGVVRGEHGRAGQSVEQGGLADVGQSSDTDSKRHAPILSEQAGRRSTHAPRHADAQGSTPS